MLFINNQPLLEKLGIRNLSKIKSQHSGALECQENADKMAENLIEPDFNKCKMLLESERFFKR